MQRPNVLVPILESLRLGAALAYRNLSIIPLFSPTAPRGPAYIPLSTALEKHLAEVSEVSQHGSVPELRIRNLSSENILLLDGEEVVGAKQNRVFNATLLVSAGAEHVIPVSCTEKRRWAYHSDNPSVFQPSNTVMAAKARRGKTAAVSQNLRLRAVHQADQCQVWEDIDELHAATASASSNAAMKDAFLQRADDLAAFAEAIPAQAGQQGMLVTLNQQIIGLDWLSQPSVYGAYHDLLLRSYAIEAIASNGHSPATQPPGPGNAPTSGEAGAALEFLKCAAELTESIHPSPATGADHRFQGRHAHGSALVVDATPLHILLFPHG